MLRNSFVQVSILTLTSQRPIRLQVMGQFSDSGRLPSRAYINRRPVLGRALDKNALPNSTSLNW
jgi:hypothetical protein